MLVAIVNHNHHRPTAARWPPQPASVQRRRLPYAGARCLCAAQTNDLEPLRLQRPRSLRRWPAWCVHAAPNGMGLDLNNLPTYPKSSAPVPPWVG